MHIEDFYEERPASLNDPWGAPNLGPSTRDFFKADLLRTLRTGPMSGDDDLETALTLTRLVHGELEAFGTGGGEKFSEEEIEQSQRCLRAVLDRHGITSRLPWRNFSGFKTYWLQNDGYNSYQARREILDGFFRPVYDQLERLDDAQLHAAVAEAVSPRTGTGWPAVDTEVSELKRRFRSATTVQDYRDVGNRCVAVLETLSRTVYDPAKHLRPGEDEPAPDKTKQRLDRYVEDSLGGAENVEVRGVAKKVIELAQKVKHSHTTTRRDAGIAADAVILITNILRRVDQP